MRHCKRTTNLNLHLSLQYVVHLLHVTNITSKPNDALLSERTANVRKKRYAKECIQRKPETRKLEAISNRSHIQREIRGHLKQESHTSNVEDHENEPEIRKILMYPLQVPLQSESVIHSFNPKWKLLWSSALPLSLPPPRNFIARTDVEVTMGCRVRFDTS